MPAAPRAGTVGKGGKTRRAVKPAATAKPTQAPGSRIRGPKTGGVSRARLSGQKMNEGAGKRGAARQQRQQTMAIQRQMLGRVKPGKSAEPLATGGTLAARASLGRARAKAGQGASPAQRGAVKRAGTYLKASRERNRTAVKGAMPRGTMAKPKGQKPGPVNATQSTRLPAAQRPGSLTNTLGKTLRNLARADAARIREIESITGQKIRRTPAGAGAAKEAGARVRAVAKGGKVGPTLRAGLRELAQSDARSAREMASIVRDATPKLAGGKGGKAIRGGRPALPGGKAKAVAAKSVKRSQPDLSQGSFERRARATEKRAKAAERVADTVDRYNPANRRLVNRANSLRSAADSYASYARRGKNNPDFSAADLFKRRGKSSTAPALTRSEKAAATRRAKADKRFRDDVRQMEQARRR